ncbi:SIMPL domain-containing protein [Chloroflexota bacterium]
MKRILWLTICLLLIIPVLFISGCDSVLAPPVQPKSTSSGQQNSGIWVTGTGEVTIAPDIAILEVGVEAQETTVGQAQAKASGVMDDIMAALSKSNIKDEDIQTQYFRIRQRTRWDDSTEKEVVVGYQVTNSVTAKIRYIDNVSSIIEAVVTAGGDLIRINDLDFSVEDPSEYYDEAREKATADAKTRAEKLAKQTGVKLGAPIYIAEGVSMSPISEGMAYSVAIKPAPMPAPSSTLPPISPGEVKVSLTVQIAYDIR